MNEMVKMVVVITLLSGLSGGLLAGVRIGTKDKIEDNELSFIKGPAVKEVLKGCSNDPISDRFKLKVGEKEQFFFVGKVNGKPKTVAFESSGKGFGGDLGLIVGFDISENKIVGIGVTTHKETPGLGSKAKDDPKFSSQFKAKAIDKQFKVKPDGGEIDAISGATVTSKGVCLAVNEAVKSYQNLKTDIEKKLAEFNK
ncbi:MAG: RnfABCDGE type electron transport complex subunit G [Desulfobacterales bacterium]|nr:RnfABCDGE type electron transport complex subunit G [Desulfobacterales bacterium]